MANAFLSYLTCLFLALASPVLAEPEIHVVAVGKGQQPEDFYALPVARVVVDRPGRDVALVLLDGGEVHWRVEATTGTIISEIIRSGPDPRDSRITLSGIPMNGIEGPDLPLVFQPRGRDFRSLIGSVTDRFGIGRIHSFQGVHQVHDATVRVDRVDTATPGLSRDYLAPGLDTTDDLPPDLRDWMKNGTEATEVTVTFDATGISLTGPAGTRRFPASPDVPPILLPVTGVFDPGSRMIYAITYGGEGYLYAVDAQSGAWAVVTSLEDYDAAGLLYDPDSRQLVTTGAFSRPGEIRVYGLDGRHRSIFIPTTDFPGLTDLFDYGNEHGPPLTPRAYSEGWLLLDAIAVSDADDPDSGAYRLYAVAVATGEVRLLRYRND